MAAPLVILRAYDHLRPHRIQDHVPQNLTRVFLVINQTDVKPALKQVPIAFVPVIEGL